MQRVLGNYRLVASLGEGGMAQVYLGIAKRSSGFNKLLVLKVLRQSPQAEGDFVQSFQDEAKIAARLNHPNVVQTYEIGEDAGVHFMAMEYLEGQPLSSIYAVVGRKNVPLGIQLRVLCDLLDGLDYAHNLADYDGSPLKLVHRDVSPHNVIVTYSGVSKLLDFGIARISGMTKTQEGVIKGKVGYIAPEQLAGERVDRRADLFAAGVMLWEVLAARRITTPGEGDMAVMSRRVVGTDPKIRVVNPDVAPDLADICDKAMAFEVENRFPTAAAMREAIEGYAQPRGLLPDSRAVATFLAKHFTEHRERLLKLINEHIKNDEASILALQASPSEPGSGPAMARSVRDGRDPLGGVVAGGNNTSTKRTVLIAAGAAIVTGGLLVALKPTVRKTEASTATLPAASAEVRGAEPMQTAPTASTGADASPAGVIHLRVRVTPPAASVSVDGAVVPNPADLTLGRGSAHTISAHLTGFVPQVRSIEGARDEDVAMQLLPSTPVGGQTPSRRPSAKPVPPAGRTSRDIDKDPYQ